MERIEALIERVMVNSHPDELESTGCEQVRVTMEGFEGDKHAGITRLSDAPFQTRDGYSQQPPGFAGQRGIEVADFGTKIF